MISTDPPTLRRSAQPVVAGLAAVFCLTLLVLGIACVGYFRLVDAGRSRGIGETRDVYFTPGDQATNEIVKRLNAATATVHVQAYVFTSAPIAKALVEAKRRGVDVIAVLDKSQQAANYSSADFLAHQGVPTFIDAQHAIAHNKIMIIDGGTVITGSFNFTKAAEEKNAENLLVLHDPALASKYEANWQLHLQHSTRYWGR